MPDLELSSNDWVVENNVIRGNQGTAVSVSNGMIVRDNLIAENSVLGVGGGTVIDVVVEGNEFRDNSIDPGIDPLQEAGALKLGAARGLRLAGNVVVGGGGPGLWCDIDCQDVVIEGNDISGLSGIGAVGISYEASSDAVIRGNVVSDVRWECRPESGIGIHVFDSRDVEVTGNTTTEVDNHVIVTQDDRRRAPADINYWQLAVADDVDFLWRTEDVTVRGNTMIGGGDQCQVGGVVGQSRGAVGVAIRHTGDHPNLVDVTDSIVWVDNDYDGTEDSLLFLWQQQDGSQAELRFADWSELGNR